MDLQKPMQPDTESDVISAARHAYSRSLLHIVVYFGISIGLLLIIQQFLPENLSNPEAVTYLINFLPMYLVAFPVYLLLSKTLPASPPEKALKMKPHHFLLAFLCAEGLGICGNLVGVIINFILTLIIGTQTASSFLTTGILGENGMLLMFFAVFCAPIVEEFLFRKVLIDRTRKYGTGTAMLASGLLFGLFHGNFSQFFYAALLGIFFAYIYLRTGNILNTIIMHMMVNTWGSLIPMLFLKNLDTEKLLDALQNSDLSALLSMAHDMIPFFCFTACTYAIAITGIVLLLVNRKKFSLPPAETPVPKERRFYVVCINLGMLCFIGICLFEFIHQIRANM